jgi:hypothetical protein
MSESNKKVGLNIDFMKPNAACKSAASIYFYCLFASTRFETVNNLT